MFYGHLDLMGARDIISSTVPLTDFQFSKLESVSDFIVDCIKNNLRMKIIRDYDADGAYSGEVPKEVFDAINYTNYTVSKYTKRTHNIDVNAVVESYTDGTEVLIILDTGSSEIDFLRKIMYQGKKVVVIDHHESKYNYTDYEGVHIINTTMEAKLGNPFYKLSAGALTYLVFKRVLEKLGRPPVASTIILALCSMYSDSIDMSTPYARNLYQQAMDVPKGRFPLLISRFMGENTAFTRRFIEFNLTPPINTLIRSENFGLLNDLLDWTPRMGPVSEIVEEIRAEHGRYSSEITRLAEIINKKIVGEFILGDLGSIVNNTFIPYDHISNYTGLIANKIANALNRPAVVYGDSGVNVKASVRDLRGRNFLGIFKNFSDSNGHNSAFAINIPYRGLNQFLQYLSLVDTSKYELDLNEPIILDYTLEPPTEELVYDMAFYNEFAGSKLPFFYVSKVWKVKDKLTRRTDFRNYYKWEGFQTKSSTLLLPNTKVIMRPTRSYKRNNKWYSDFYVEAVNT